MRVDAFDFDLPEDRIALRPAEPRDAARLLQVSGRGDLSDHGVRDLPSLLKAGDLLVLNETRVLPTQLFGRRWREGADALDVAVTLVEQWPGDGLTWRAFAKPGRRLKPGDRLTFPADAAQDAAPLRAELVERGEEGLFELRFDGTLAGFAGALNSVGLPPLPPYIAAKRGIDESDKAAYQTVYARTEGSVAAPTAGLHFTDALFTALDAGGIARAFVTLHVGMGTFLPVKAETTDAHTMHAEWGEVTEQTAAMINETRARGGRVVSVGTTSLRILESAVGADGRIQPFTGETDIFITPGYRFGAIDGLMTNFHLPKSTLFMLVSALCGLDTMKTAYAHAIAQNYRFYSYGDASLLWAQAGARR
ncbi:MAG: tRNA preQ1(34) S-adenosylmethionine ribosyltransferase-isomerase QueA [Devosiaceae bacterium]|nr:tRNA preQ1(34) S-adenosylmethionine ribosyltransferase-isomerase QueA [Devosiaceae bacterium MH13]